MRLIAILILAGCLQASARGFAQTVTLSASAMPLEKVCESIEAQTGYYFLYTKNHNDKPWLIDVQLKNMPLSEALHKIFEGLPFTYQFIDKVVVVTAVAGGKKDAIASNTDTPKDTLEVKGWVTNKDYESLANATISSVKTKKATQTNEKGRFTLQGLPPDDELVITYVGYKTTRIKVAGKNQLTVLLEPATDDLDKAVVQAYGTTSKRFTTSNISVVTSEDIKRQPLSNPLLALEGRVAGLVITPQSSYENGPIKVELRGRNGVNPAFTSDPLYIIDGVPLTILDVGGTRQSYYSSNAISPGLDQTGMSFLGGQNPLSSLNAADIESIEVLKDADATAIYGSRGAAGVILITTKRGRTGKMKLDLDVAQGETYASKEWDMLNTSQYLEMRREAFKNDTITPTPQNAPDLLVWDTTKNTDWQKYFFGHPGLYTNVQSAVSGGSGQTTYRIGGGYLRTTDISTLHGLNQKASMAVNINSSSQDQRFKVGFSANYTYTNNNMNNSQGSSTVAADAPPIYDASGNFNFAPWRSTGSPFPFYGLMWTYGSRANFLTSTLTLNYTVVKGLVARASIGYNISMNNQMTLEPKASMDPDASVKPTGSAIFGNTNFHNWIIEPQLEYNAALGQGSLNVLGGATIQENATDGLSVDGRGYTDDVLLRSISNAPSVTAFDFSGQYKYGGLFARIGYRLLNKYILNLNGRRDGSSRFGPGKQFGNFGSVGAAWIASEEGWLKKALPKAISFVKFRGSYGITGSDGVGDYKFLSQWGNTSTPLTSYNGVPPLTPLIEANPNFHWQVNKKLEGALDLSFVHDRINFEVAWYQDRCNNQLISYPTAAFTGFTSVTANSPADVQNSGLEFLVNARIIDTKGFTWSTDVNLAFNRNKLLAYPDFQQSPYYSIYKIGKSLDNMYLLNYTGVDPVSGHYTYSDNNKDGAININTSVPPGTGTDDRTKSINLNPKYSGGWGNHFTWHRMALTAFFTFRDQIGQNALTGPFPGGFNNGSGNVSKWQFDHRWQKPGDNALVARFTTNPTINDQLFSSSTGAWTNASFLRLQNLAFSYSLADKWAKKMGMSRLLVNVSAQNIFVITPYKGLDPELTTFGTLPAVRTVTAGISCSF